MFFCVNVFLQSNTHAILFLRNNRIWKTEFPASFNHSIYTPTPGFDVARHKKAEAR